jgi:iron complex outermembrane receptor protein
MKCACGAVAVLAFACLGPDELLSATNREVVVTATRIEKRAGEIPAGVTVVTGEEIRSAARPSLVDALEAVCGVQVRSLTGNPAQAEVSLRGFGENAHGRVLVLVDGRRLNRPDMAAINWLQIPVSNVSRVEVIRGAGSSLYGDNAVGGVINIVTLSGAEGAGSFVEAQGGSYGLRLVRAATSGADSRATYAASAEHYQLDGYRDRSAFRSQGGGGRASWEIGEALSMSLSISGQGVEYELPGALTREQMRMDRRQAVDPANGGRDAYWNVDAGLDAQMGGAQRGSLHAVYGRKDVRSDMASWFSFSDVLQDTVGLLPRYEWKGRWVGVDHTLFAGGDVYFDRLRVDRFGDETRTLRSVGATVERRAAGAYLREEAELGGWRMGVGGRHDVAVLDAKASSPDGSTEIDQSVTHRVSAGEVSAIRAWGTAGRAFARVATVYRLPFVDEQVSYYGFGGDAFYADIALEKGWTAEVGGTLRAGTGFKAELTLYWLNMSDEIAYNNVTFRNENLDDTRHEGVEAEVSWQVANRLRLHGQYALSRSTFSGGANEGNDIPLTPRHTLSAGAVVDLAAGLSIEGTATRVSGSYFGGDYANAGGRLPGHTVVDLLARYSHARLASVEMFAGVDNAFGQKYSSLGYLGWDGEAYFYPSPERTFKAGVSWRL